MSGVQILVFQTKDEVSSCLHTGAIFDHCLMSKQIAGVPTVTHRELKWKKK